MIVVLKEEAGGKVLGWTGSEWTEEKDKIKKYEMSDDNFSFGNPLPVVGDGEQLCFMQIDCRAKWRMLNVPSPEESLATLRYYEELESKRGHKEN
jgi:hypothetical protein